MIWDRSRPEATALIDAASGRVVTHGELFASASERAEALRQQAGSGGLVALFCRNDVETVFSYVAARLAGVATALLDARTPSHRVADLVARYRPQVVLGLGDGPSPGVQAPPVHPDLALLLTTSGSTGSPKLVRLTAAAVDHNAAAIATGLGITSAELAPTSLPLHYSYGLSILNSHLAVGAALLVTEEGLMSQPFWQACAEHGATSMAGVPYSWQMLRRLDLAALAPPSMTTFTQAGGRLEPRLAAWAHGVATARGGRFFVMYGQTEAVARIAILPSEDLPAKLGSAGRAVAGGALSIDPPGGDGEVVYRGPNVMMGYAEGREDLTLGDELRGELRTGDLGHLDADGFLWITGRSKRIGKVFGVRLNLDEIEILAREATGLPTIAAVAAGDRVSIQVEHDGPLDALALSRSLSEATGLHASGFAIRVVPALPRLANGKVDYGALEV